MKYRDHRNGLAQSLATMVELEPTRATLLAHLAQTWPFDQGLSGLSLEGVVVERYHSGGDSRIGWPEVWIVRLPGFGVLGFTDGGLNA